MTRREDEELMAFLDGELAPRDAREVEARLAASPDGQKKVEALGELSEILRGHYDAACEEVEPQMLGAWAKLEAQLEAAPAPEKKTARAAAGVPGVSESPGFLASVAAFFSSRGGYIATGVVAAAAGAILAMRFAPEKVRTVEVQVPVDRDHPPPATVTAQATEIEELEVASGSGMVFQVPSDDEAKPATTVIWLNDDGTEGPI